MKKGFGLILLVFLFYSCSEKKMTIEITDLCIIGTIHDSTEMINPTVLYDILEQVQPDVILCELESHFFTDSTYNISEYPDLLSTNENIATYRFQQKHNIDLRPYEMEGRNEYYRTTSYFDKEQSVFTAIMNAYNNKTLSEESSLEWDRFLKLVPQLDVLNSSTLEDINSELYMGYSEAKNMIRYNTCISITKRDMPDYYNTAKELKKVWNTRNNTMRSNILSWCKKYKGKTIVVLTGQQHKYYLQNSIRQKADVYELDIKEFWEFDLR